MWANDYCLCQSGFQITVEKPKPKQSLRAITTGTNSAMNQSQFLVILHTCNSLKEREKSRVHGAIGFGFPSHWLKNWRESFKPITKRSNRNHAITFDSHLKTALSSVIIFVMTLVQSHLFIYYHFFVFSFSEKLATLVNPR